MLNKKDQEAKDDLLNTENEYLDKTTDRLKEDNTTKLIKGFEEEKKRQTVYSSIFKQIFEADYESIKQGFKNEVYTADTLNEELNGNSPLFIAVMLCSKEEKDNNRYKIVELLLKSGGDVLKKNAEKWSLTEVAASIKNQRIVTTLYEYKSSAKLKSWRRNQEIVMEHLKNIPDSYLEIKWNINSGVIPFLSYFTPSDTYKIWKVGSSLRLDFTFLGYESGKQKTSEMSLLMREKALLKDEHPEFVMIDRKEKVIYYPSHGSDEKAATELSDKELTKKKTKIKEFNSKALKDKKKIHGREAQKYILKFNLEKSMKKLGNCLITSKYEDYKDNTETLTKEDKLKDKHMECPLWISNDYPLKLSDVMPMIKTLAVHDDKLKKLEEYLRNEAVKELIEDNGFPVRIQIPFGYTVYAEVSFTVYNKLTIDKDEYEKMFMIPEDYKV